MERNNGGAASPNGDALYKATPFNTMATVDTCLGPLSVDDRGGSDQPAALLWPSLFTDHRMWDAQVAALGDIGWRTLALDPPGHGRSLGPGRGFTMDQCADAVLQVLDAKEVRAPVVVMGTSWGCFVAPRVAMRAPERVRGIVTFNTSAEPALPMQRLNAHILVPMLRIAALDGVADRILLSSMLAPETRQQRPRIGTDLIARLRSWDRARMVMSVQSVLLDRDGVLDALPTVTCPALVVSGNKDNLLPTPLSLHMVRRLPDACHVEVADAAHLIPLEASERANALIVDFVRSLKLDGSQLVHQS